MRYKIQHSSNDATIYDRLYLTVYDSDPEIQKYLKELFSDISRGTFEGLSGVLINQLEISYDLFTHEHHQLKQIQRFIYNHILIKFLKPESYGKCFTTLYAARNANIRTGAKGIRCYLKHENGKDFFRIEMQYNRLYFSKNKITVQALPLNPQSFQSFDHVELLDNFSAKGTSNFSTSLLRKKGITRSTCTYKEFTQLHTQEVHQLNTQVFGINRGPKRAVHKQLATLKSIKKESGLSVNTKQYFKPLDSAKQLICCLADTGYEEANCSKRVVGLKVA